MLTREENELLCRVEGDAPMGQLMRRHWHAGVPRSRRCSEPDGSPVRARCSARTSSRSATPTAASACIDELLSAPPRVARASGATRTAACAASTTAGRWTSTATCSRCRPSPPAAPMPQKVKHKAYPTQRVRRLRVGLHGAAGDDAGVRAAAVRADRRTRACAIVKIVVDCNWAQVLEGAIDSAHSSTLHSSDMVPARVDGAKATTKAWLRPSTDKAPRLQVAARRLRLPLRGDPPADRERGHQRLRAHHGVRRADHRADPAEQPVQRRERQRADATTRTRCSTSSRGAIRRDTAVDTEAWRKFCGARSASTSIASSARCATSATDFLQDRQAMKARQLHRHHAAFPNQDIAMWETMGPIADRTQERLGASDLAIVEFRRLMVDAVRDFSDGQARDRHRRARHPRQGVLVPGDRAEDRATGRRTTCKPVLGNARSRARAVVRRLRRSGNACQAQALARLLELRPHARARGRLGAARRHRPQLPRPAGRGDVLPHAAPPRVRRRGDVAVVVHGVDVPRAAAVRRDPGLPVALLPPLVASTSTPMPASASRRT